MFESVVFFEPYRAVLQALQDFSYETFPMLDYFLGCEKNRTPALYLEDSSVIQLKCAAKDPHHIFCPMESLSWPSATALGLDEKQHQAFIAALTSRLSLIQGPPGTGKTFLALKIVNALLDNKQLWQAEMDNEEMLSKLRHHRELSPNWRLRNR